MVPEATGKFTPRDGKNCCIFNGDGDTSALWVLCAATTVTQTKGRVPVETLIQCDASDQVGSLKKKKNTKAPFTPTVGGNEAQWKDGSGASKSDSN